MPIYVAALRELVVHRRENRTDQLPRIAVIQSKDVKRDISAKRGTVSRLVERKREIQREAERDREDRERKKFNICELGRILDTKAERLHNQREQCKEKHEC